MSYGIAVQHGRKNQTDASHGVQLRRLQQRDKRLDRVLVLLPGHELHCRSGSAILSMLTSTISLMWLQTQQIVQHHSGGTNISISLTSTRTSDPDGSGLILSSPLFQGFACDV